MQANGQAAEHVLLPFLKWAGGKRWLLRSYPEYFPKVHGIYFEPFLGSAATFFGLRPSRAVLSDSNESLIDCYRAIKKDPEKILLKLTRHARKHSKRYYYETRESGLSADDLFDRSAAFIYLNRVCWNGLYRVNLEGKFNVPIGTKTRVILDTDDFKAVSKLLKRAALKSGDFSETLELAGRGDFVFADPPYTVRHNSNGFIKYNESLFSWSDQERLRDSLMRASRRGALFLVTNADHPSVRKLYSDFAHVHKVRRQSVVAAHSKFRGGTTEIVITNY